MDGGVKLLLRMMDEAYDRKAWHGTNLRGSVKGLNASEACWRPAPGRHNIWEIVLHAAYWKYALRRRLTGASRGSFPLKGSNWFPVSDSADGKAWREAVRLLDLEHRMLREALAGLTARKISQRTAGSRHTPLEAAQGIALHDVYHAGQIQLLKRLGARPDSRRQS